MCLLTSYHTPRDRRRAGEYELVLRANVQNPYLHEVHLFVEANTSLPLQQAEMSKVVLHQYSGQPTYKAFFEYANSKLADCVVIIANSDIVMTASIFDMHQLRPGHVLAVSRHMLARPEYTGWLCQTQHNR